MSTTGKAIIPRERLDLAERLFIAGKGRQAIARALCAEYHVTARTARNYIARVEAKIAALPKSPPEAVFQRTEAMLLETYEKARDGVKRMAVAQGGGVSVVEEFPESNVGVMATVAVRLAELYGVGGVHRVDITSGGKPLAALTDDEIDERERAALAAANAATLPH